MQRRIGLVAYDDNRCMGNGDKLPWHLPEDLKWFKEVTEGFPLIMGRKTWMSLPSAPLKNRPHIIVSANTVETIVKMQYAPGGRTFYPHPKHKDVVVVASPFMALEYARVFHKIKDKVFIIGGATLFKSMLEWNVIDEMWITHVHGYHPGDVFFPAIPVQFANQWYVTDFDKHYDFDRIKVVKR